MRFHNVGYASCIVDIDLPQATIGPEAIAAFLGIPRDFVRAALMRFGAHMLVITRNGIPAIEFRAIDVERWLSQQAAIDFPQGGPQFQAPAPHRLLLEDPGEHQS